MPQAIPHVPLSSEARHNLFLAFEEALNNVLKHSGASKVKVEMIGGPSKFEILITDNGRGFEMNGKPGLTAQGRERGRTGNGLRNMRQRLADIGGECVIRSQSGAGTTVSLQISLNHIPGRKP
jgi:signal transduction histidine kinase